MIKLHYDILYDYKTATLPDRYWRRYIELLLIAGNEGESGNLPPIGKMAHALQMKRSDLKPDLDYLEGNGFIECHNGQWLIPNFETKRTDLPPRKYEKFRKEIYQRDGNECVYCGGPAEHLDHIAPQSNNGKDEPSNLVAACGHCNRSKKDNDIITWYQSRSYFDPVRLNYVLSILKDDYDV